jgi:glycosyltransferase involved in cell wall biosynthesis
VTETRPIKVLFLLPGLEAGGAERVTITLMNGLDRTRFRPILAVVDGSGPLRALIHPSILIYDLHCPRFAHALPRLFKTLRTVRPDIVFSTMAHMNFAVLLLKPLFPKARVIVREAIVPSYFKAHRHWRLVRLAYRTLYRRADCVVSPAQAIQREFKTMLGLKLKRQALLYNPVDAEAIRGGIESKPAPDGTVRFIAAGRLNHQKGFDRLLQALPSLRHPQPWSLTILGEGAERATLEAMIRSLNLGDRVTLAGHSDRPWAAYAEADCLLLPSRSEGMPNVALEALACGTSVIATRESGGIEEIAAQAAPGAVTIADDMKAFTAAMAHIAPHSPETPFPSPSLLPEAFRRDRVLAAFEALLTGLSAEKN